MAENETVLENNVESQPELSGPTKGQKFKANLKERFRKFIVKLKHKTHLIPLVILLITSLIYLCCLGNYSKLIDANSGIAYSGISVFVPTLVSILVLVVFLNAFPKRKKPNIVMIVMVFVCLALIAAMDILLYVNTIKFCTLNDTLETYLSNHPEVQPALTDLIVHLVFLGISILALAFLPLYKKGINMINTKKDIAENEIKEEIDTSAEV